MQRDATSPQWTLCAPGGETHGPFPSQADAWKYLFGRFDATLAEVEQYEFAGWRVEAAASETVKPEAIGEVVGHNSLGNPVVRWLDGGLRPIDLMAELKAKLPQGVPVAWRYRLKPKPGKEPMPWKYVDQATEVNPLDAYESEPVYAAPATASPQLPKEP